MSAFAGKSSECFPLGKDRSLKIEQSGDTFIVSTDFNGKNLSRNVRAQFNSVGTIENLWIEKGRDYYHVPNGPGRDRPTQEITQFLVV